MKPILFASDATNFTTNGLGRLDCHECKVTEERNGQFELEMTIAESALHANQIEMTSIIVARASQGSGLQAFRVYRITKPLNGVFKVYANHISYQLSLIPTMPFSVVASVHACEDTLDELVSNAVEACPFTFTTDVTTVASYSQSTPASIRSRLGGVQGSVLDQFGGEYEWDNYSVTLHENRGVTIPTVTLRYGKNITDLNQEENIANTITGIVPFWADNEGHLVTLPEKVVNSSHASDYPFKRTVPVDFSDDFEEQPTEAELRTKAQAYVTGIGVPVVSIKLSFVNLADTEEYKDVAPLQSVNLCDVINVQFEKYGITTTAKIVKTVYDVLGEKYESLEIGSLRSSLSTTINDQNASTQTEIASKFGKIGDEIDNATAWLTNSGGYVVAVKNNDGTWKELLFLDDNDIDTAVNVLRINENGIGFSSNGVNGPYTQAWTLDGRLVIGGTNVPSITVYDSDDNIIFQADATAMIWNAGNSSMDSDGYITMNGATIRNGVITMIGSRSWLWLEDGVIYGGRGTTVGQNQTQIEYDHLVNGQAGNINLKAKNVVLSVDGMLVKQHESDSNGYIGYDGNYVISNNYFSMAYMNNFSVNWATLNNVCTDLSINWGSQSATWNIVSFSYPSSITWNDVTSSVAMSENHRTMIHGIGT